MRTTDEAPLPVTGPILVSPQQPPAQITLSERLKAVSLLALTGGLGLGVFILGRSLLQSEREETFAPLSIDRNNQSAQQSPLRDRVPILSPGTVSVSPPEALESPATPLKTQVGRRQADPQTTLTTSQGFGKAAPPPAIVANAVPEAAAPGQSQSAAPASPGAAPRQTTLPTALIASLLQSPQMGAPTGSGNVALAPPLPSRGNPTTGLPAQPDTATPTQPAAPGGGISTPTTPIASESAPASQQTARREGVYVERLKITGNTRFSEQQLAQAVQGTIATGPSQTTPPKDPAVFNRRFSPAELVRASEAITKLYTDRGYINSGAYVPAEVLQGANPEIRVVEGSLGTINVKVEPPGFLWLARPLSANYVRRRLARLVPAPLQIDQLVDAVKLLEQDPLIGAISTELAPGTSTGSSILNVRVQQAPPLRATYAIDNGRSPSVGRLRQQINLSHANILGLGDRLQVGYNWTSGSRGLDLGYTIPLNPNNTTLSFNYGSSRGQVIEEPFQDLDIKSRSRTYEVALRHPLKQTSSEAIALTLRGTHYQNEGVFLESFNEGVPLPFPSRGSDESGNTRITAIRFGQEWLKRGQRDVFSLQSEFSLGLAALDATILSEPPDGRFLSWQGRGFWVHSFAPDTLFALKGQVQLASRPLVPVEQISIGGIDTVRGYRTSTLLADSGWFASAELYLPVLRIPKWQGVLQVVPFFDIGRGRNLGDEQPTPNSVMSTGIGLQWKMGDNFRARVDWGIPLINVTSDNGQSRREGVFFSVVYSP